MLEDFTKVMSNGQVLPTSCTGSSKYAFSTYTLKVYQVHCIIYDSHNVLLRPLEYFRQVGGIKLMVKGRKSGQSISRPVWFVYQNNIFYLLPVNGSDTEWFKNVLHNPQMKISVNKKEFIGNSNPITNENKVREVVDKFRSKYSAENIARYYSKLDAAVEFSLQG